MQTFVRTKPVYQELRILPSGELKFNQLTFIFDYLQEKLPKSLPNIWHHDYQVNFFYDLRNGQDFFIWHLDLKSYPSIPYLRYLLFGTTFFMILRI